MNSDQDNVNAGEKYLLFKELYAHSSYPVKESEFIKLKEALSLTDVFLLSTFWESGMEGHYWLIMSSIFSDPEYNEEVGSWRYSTLSGFPPSPKRVHLIDLCLNEKKVIDGDSFVKVLEVVSRDEPNIKVFETLFNEFGEFFFIGYEY